MSDSNKNHNKAIFEIRSNNQKKISSLYDEHRAPFINYSTKNFDLPRNVAEDIYQEAFLALHENVEKGKLTNLTVPLRTYLFQIGKNMIYDHFRRERNEVELESLEKHLSSDGELGNFNLTNADGDSLLEQKRRVIYNTVSQMEYPCNDILFYFYWEGRRMKEIADLMNYSSEDVVKSQKVRCIKKIKLHVTEILRKTDLTSSKKNG